MTAKCADSFSDDVYNFNEWADEVAKARGQIVVYPEENQLQLDIDTDEQYETFKKRIIPLHTILGWVFTETDTPSRQGIPHRHITITVKGKVFTEVERIALQFMLGSDDVRESLNLLRMLNGHLRPSRLFENKE